MKKEESNEIEEKLVDAVLSLHQIYSDGSDFPADTKGNGLKRKLTSSGRVGADEDKVIKKIKAKV